MHICYASLSYPLNSGTSGVGAQTQVLARGLTARGDSVSVIALKPRMETEFIDDEGVRIYPTATTNLHWHADKIPALGFHVSLPIRELEYSYAAWQTLARIRTKGTPDLVGATETGALFIALLSRNIPVVIRLHGEQYTFHKYTPGTPLPLSVRLSRFLQRIALRRVRMLISPSVIHAREIANELGPRHPPIVVIPNNIECGNECVQSGAGEAIRESATVLYVGRIERLKGIAVLLQAIVQVARVIPDVRFVFAGRFQPTAFKTEFEMLAQRLGVQEHITLLGEVDQETLRGWCRRATLGVLPSYYETFGLAALEEMSFGLPVVGTRETGLSEVIQDNVNGLLVERGNVEMLADALVKLLEDASLRSRLGHAAIERAKNFSIHQVLPKNIQCYEWVKSHITNEPGPHLFLSPHADDVVLSCGGIIHALVPNGKTVQVVNVFSGQSQVQHLSAFACHLHAKWGLEKNTVFARRQEDLAALQELGLTAPLYWEFLEAPYRCGTDSRPLYATYDEMRGKLAEEDGELEQALLHQVIQLLDGMPETTVVYVPLALGQHVDHQILFRVGRMLGAAGRHVRFYEDFPYVENYALDPDVFNWVPKAIPISVTVKTQAAEKYTSQLRGLGGSSRVVAERLAHAARAVNKRQPAERLWEYIPRDNETSLAPDTNEPVPLRLKPRAPSFNDGRKFLETFRWHDLDELLPYGSGICLDVGCGQGRHRQRIEARGYRWVGLERGNSSVHQAQGDAENLGIASARLAAVTLWQVMEYAEHPEQVVAEAARVLEPGGVFCGSVSFLEPLHGQTLYNLSPVLLERLLKKRGFGDIEIRAGLNGFALLLWTWLRRTGVPRAEALALPLAFMGLALPAFFLFLCSWVSLRLGFGNGHTMQWLSERAPLEFAGHVLFVARKRARAADCTSDS